LLGIPLLILAALMGLAVVPTCFAQQDATEKPAFESPLTPDESLQHFKLLSGLRMELVASEPEVIDPVAVRFDEFGRMWVVEMRDYPHGPAEGEEPRSMIKMLEDRDGDGRFEHVQVFADKLLFVTGVQPWRGGVIVTMAGEVAYMRDTDGDGKADERETWYTGFAQENSQLRANHPRFGLDNHIYISNGLRGGTVVDARKEDSQPVALNGKDFRFHPETFAYEALTGVGQFGLTFDDYGNRFVCSNRNPLIHIVLEDRYIARNASYAPPTVVHDVAKAGEASRVFPISRAWTTSNLHAGQFTAACGCLLYRGHGMPKRFYGNSFTCDPTGNFVHRELIGPSGPTFTGRPARDGVEFLASPDEWFRPVNLTHGPDGALYVVDMYRAVIEHPQWVPDELKDRLDTLFGNDRGRIYRITAMAKPAQYRWPKLAEMPSGILARLLEHPNVWQRETAARLLYERQDKSIADRLSTIATDGSHPAGRTQALWSLHGLGALDDEVIEVALRDEEPAVRAQAAALAASRFDGSPDMRERIRSLAGDESSQVRFQVALQLAPIRSDEEVATLKNLLLTDPSDVWIRRAVALATGERAVALLESILDDPPWAGGAADANEIELVRELVTLATSSKEEDTEQRVLQAILAITEKSEATRLQSTALLSFSQSLSRRRSSLKSVLANLGDAEQASVDALFERMAELAKDSSRDATRRGEAIGLLAYHEDAQATLAGLALSELTQSVRTQAIDALGRFNDPETLKKLLAEFASESPTVRRAVANSALANSARTSLMLDAIEAGNIKAAELDRSQVNRLLKHGNKEIQGRAAKLLAAAVPEDRKKVLRDYQSVLTMKADAQRGQQIFKKNCATCHQIGKIGVNVAPDISDSRTKKAEQLLTDVLQPNRAIDNNYVSYSVITADGLSLTGIITSDTASSITLKQAEGKIATLLRTEIEEMRSNGISLMPEGLEKNIPHQEMADLISFIKNWRYLDGRTPLRGAAEE
jgi:putative membrane-bound dehydrogenase-like protein